MPAMPANKATSPRWAHQQIEFDEHRDRRSRAYIWPMRSGKSRGVIDVACYRFGKSDIEGVIVIAPNGVHSELCGQRNPNVGLDQIQAPHLRVVHATTVRAGATEAVGRVYCTASRDIALALYQHGGAWPTRIASSPSSNSCAHVITTTC